MFRLDIHPEALIDIETAAVWYEEKEPGLGTDFSRTIRYAINALPCNPLSYRIRDRRRNVRWVLSSRFPFRIVYRVKDDLITVIAVIHAARHDRQWRRRTSQ
jgi:plasmid stabilization system protein ParE